MTFPTCLRGAALLFGLAALSSCAATLPTTAEPRSTATAPQKATRAHAEVRRIRLYYEIHGSQQGTPLVLLHGGGSTIETDWRTLIPLFERGRRVIALDEQNHGRSGHRTVVILPSGHGEYLGARSQDGSPYAAATFSLVDAFLRED